MSGENDVAVELLGPLSVVYDEVLARIRAKRVDPTMGQIIQDTLDVVFEKLNTHKVGPDVR